jgi:hypothetical protein
MKFLENSQKEDTSLLLQDKDALDVANTSDLADASGEEQNMHAKADDQNAAMEDPPTFFDELHARLAPSRSLKRHFLEDEVIER